ncbi:MAG TPA: hypothetical protein VNP73_07650 [Actinomycetota bacterium]|nr:hypothetical protein [Actinomycetota bacterium]
MADRFQVGSAIGRLLARGIPGVTVLLCAAAAASSLAAWQFQRSAAEDLIEARIVQGKEVQADDRPPPSASDNRAIIASLNQGIAVRQKIDEQLQRIESSVTMLAVRQREAEEITGLGFTEIRAIARSLGGASGAAQRSVDRLDDLRARLQESAELARAIAEELEELDRKMGPGGER